MISSWSIAGLLLLGLIGAWFDIRERRLPNWLCIVGLLAGLAVAVMFSGLAGLGSNAAHAILALLVGLGLYAARFVGAGDAKYYAALAAWFPILEGLRLFVSVAMMGALLALIWIAARRMRGQRAFPKDPANSERLPYGVAIAGGALLHAGLPMIGGL